ncbi:MAG: response regulator [Candidatus Aminicenantes bacterium]
MKTIKTLVVDDEVAEDIKENLENFKFHDARLSIEAVDTCQDAITRIEKSRKDKQFYDVVIVDMKMDDSEEKGLEILKLPLSSLKIVLTALPSVENCLKCTIAGAFDYIEKNSIHYDPYERLEKAIREGLEKRLKEPESPFLKWKNKNFSYLIGEYEGKYIAVIDEVVVDVDENQEALNNRLKENYPFFKAEIMEIPKKTGSMPG